jgi:hypothetical protein
MPALPIAPVGVHGFSPVELAEGDLLHPHLIEEAFDEASCRRTHASLQNDAGLGEGGSADGRTGIVQEIPEHVVVTVLPEEHAQQRRAVDDHTPSGP